jgi:dihydroorotate dehydrogenase
LTFDRFSLARPLLGLLSPETAHTLTIRALSLGLAGNPGRIDDPILSATRFGLRFSSPLGLAAGFDKNAVALDGALRLGFGFAEFGTVTPRPQPGNPKPRVFRLAAQGGVINRLGFNNEGLEAAATRVIARRKDPKRAPGVIGGNIGKNKDSPDAVADYVTGARRLSPLVDYLTVNVSSPNTPGLRALQSREALTELLAAVKAARVAPAPVLVKIAPDLMQAELEDIALVAADTGIDGIIIGNTTISRPSDLPPRLASETGGLSGKPLFELATEKLRLLYTITEGRIPLVGVGGIGSADDAYIKIRAGAALLQLYTALVYEGPGLVERIKQGLAARLKADGFQTLDEAVGADHR